MTREACMDERPDVVNTVKTLIQGQAKAGITAALRGMAEDFFSCFPESTATSTRPWSATG